MPNRFWRNVGLAFSGTAVAQAIPLVGSLAVARIYAPTEFGIFASWLSIVSLLAVVLTGRFEAALAIVADGRPRASAVWAALATTVLSACFLAGLTLALVLTLPGLMGTFPLALAWLLVPTAFLIGVANTWQSWAAAEGRLRALGGMRISQAGAVTGIQILVGLLFPSALGLAAGHFLGVLLGVLVAGRLLPLAHGWLDRSEHPWRDLKDFWAKYHRFPLLALPADAINATAAMLPLLVLTSRFGADIAGFLALALRVLGTPVSLLGAAVLDVFKRSSAASFRQYGHCRDDYWRTFTVLGAGAVLATIIVYFLSETIFVLAFGERWRQAGIFAVWLMPMFALRFVASPLSYVFYVAGKQHVDLMWQVALLLMTVATLYIPSNHAHVIQAYAIGYGFLYLVYLALSWRFSKGVKT